MKRVFFLLMLATLFLGAGCAHHDIKELFDTSFEQCQLRSSKGCAGDFLAATQNATDVGSNMIQLNGEIMPADATVVWWFEYGLDKDQLIYSTEPKIVSGVGPSRVNTHLKKLAPTTPYYYHIVAQNNSQKVYGETYSITTVDRSCFGAGTWATLSGTAMLAGGLVSSNPKLIVSGVAASTTGILDGSFWGNESDPQCKEVGGLVGGVVGYTSGRAYKKAHQPKQQKQQSAAPPPPTGPSMPPPVGFRGPAMPPPI